MTLSRIGVRLDSSMPAGPAILGRTFSVPSIGRMSSASFEVRGSHGEHRSRAIRTNPSHRRSPSAQIANAEIREPAAVQMVIEEVPGMLDMLVDAVEVLRKAFGAHANGIAIQPFVDPESTNGVVHLFVLARTPLSFAESDQILQGVVSSWWEANAARAGGRVTIDTEFV